MKLVATCTGLQVQKKGKREVLIIIQISEGGSSLFPLHLQRLPFPLLPPVFSSACLTDLGRSPMVLQCLISGRACVADGCNNGPLKLQSERRGRPALGAREQLLGEGRGD